MFYPSGFYDGQAPEAGPELPYPFELRVAIIDDEPWLAEGIRRLVPWKELGIALAGTYLAARHALEELKAKPVDLALIDLRMPEMSGLEWIEAYRAENEKCDYIIISAHDSFADAQSALRMGIFQYLLKPVGKDELIKALLQVRDKRLKARIEEDMTDYERLASVGMKEPPQQGRCMVLLTGPLKRPGQLRQALQPFAPRVFFASGDRQWIFLQGDGQMEPAVLAAVRNAIEAGARIGASRAAQANQPLSEAIDQALAQFAWDFVSPDARYPFDETPEKERIAGEAVRSALEAVLEGDAQALSARMEAIPDLFAREGLGPRHTLSFWNGLVGGVRAHSWVTDQALDIRRLSMTDMLSLFDGFAQACAYLREELCAHIGARFAHAHGDVNESFAQLLEFVNEHYMEKLSLGALAARFYLNESYACKLFHTATGYTFMEYLVKLRLEQAMRRILAGEKDLTQLSAEVGYNNYYYFVRSFNERFGIAPDKLV